MSQNTTTKNTYNLIVKINYYYYLPNRYKHFAFFPHIPVDKTPFPTHTVLLKTHLDSISVSIPVLFAWIRIDVQYLSQYGDKTNTKSGTCRFRGKYLPHPYPHLSYCKHSCLCQTYWDGHSETSHLHKVVLQNIWRIQHKNDKHDKRWMHGRTCGWAGGCAMQAATPVGPRENGARMWDADFEKRPRNIGIFA